MVFVLQIHPDKCVGCRICENICSFQRAKRCVAPKSAISVYKSRVEDVVNPITCMHCLVAICEKACPVGAISRNEETGAMLIDEDTCIGCRVCMVLCPFGAPSIDMETQTIIKCDLCKGEPKCVKWCPTGAIEYIRADRVGMLEKEKKAEKFEEIIKSLMTMYTGG